MDKRKVRSDVWVVLKSVHFFIEYVQNYTCHFQFLKHQVILLLFTGRYFPYSCMYVYYFVCDMHGMPVLCDPNLWPYVMCQMWSEHCCIETRPCMKYVWNKSYPYIGHGTKLCYNRFVHVHNIFYTAFLSSDRNGLSLSPTQNNWQ